MIPNYQIANLKYRAFQDDEMLYQKESGIYAAKKFLDKLYEDCILMQSKGLQDKNKVEFFDGDIVKGFFREQNRGKEKVEEIIGVVKNHKISWRIPNISDSCFCGISCIPWRDRCEFYWQQRGSYVTPDIGYCIEDIEIIGNECQNPELLKEKA